MTRQDKHQAQALKAYEQYVHEAQELLTRITTQVDEMDGHAEAGAIGWGDVGDASDIKKALKEIADRMFREGEYRPSNIAR